LISVQEKGKRKARMSTGQDRANAPKFR